MSRRRPGARAGGGGARRASTPDAVPGRGAEERPASRPGRGAAAGSRARRAEEPGGAASVRRPPPDAGTPPGTGSPWRHPAAWAALAVAAASILVSVSFRIDDPDLWQHLAVGRAIWERGEVPRLHLWTWPSHGEPYVLPSWLFRALLWPFWSAGGEVGLWIWRWLTTLAAFAFLFLAARRLGARGLVVLPVLALAALGYRMRSQARPETLVAVLLAAELWILAGWGRGGGGRRLWALVPVAWAWANVHLSYTLGLALIAFHAIDAAVRRDPARPAGALVRVGLACVLVSFLNPFGWRALAQPFEFALAERHEPIFRAIVELQPLQAAAIVRNGLVLLLAGWPLLALWRARRRGVDLAEALALVAFTALALSAHRAAGLYALVAAPWVARDLDAWLRERRALRLALPVRATAAAAACVALALPEWTRREYPIRIGFDWLQYPVAACDFMEREGVRGRGFNPFYYGGYLLWRFWPDPGRLPFMDIHQSGSREDRRLYAFAFGSPEAWRELDRRRRFDWTLLEARQLSPGDRLLETLSGDTAWTTVFRDDAAALLVRASGPLAGLAERHGYRWLPPDDAGMAALLAAYRGHPAARAPIRAEAERQVRSSPHHARALSILATLEWIDGRPLEARAHLERALALDPELPGTRLRLARLDLEAGRHHRAVGLLEAERALGTAGVDLLLGQAHRMAGDLGRARAAYRRALRLEPGNAAAAESLSAIEGRR